MGADRLAFVCVGLIAVAVAACSDTVSRARDDDPYQACLDRAYRTGDVGVYGPGSLERRFPGDGEGRRGLPYPSRLNWPQSPVDQCNNLRSRGLL